MQQDSPNIGKNLNINSTHPTHDHLDSLASRTRGALPKISL